MKPQRFLSLPILMLNTITKPLFKLSSYLFYNTCAKIVDSKLVDRILAKLDEKEKL